MLPTRNLDFLAIARQLIEEYDLPKEVNAYRHHKFRVEDVIAELLRWRSESQFRSGGGEWQYSYDPVTVSVEAIGAALLDSARTRLGCTEWGCNTMADTNEIELLDEDDNILNTKLERTE